MKTEEKVIPIWYEEPETIPVPWLNEKIELKIYTEED